MKIKLEGGARDGHTWIISQEACNRGIIYVPHGDYLNLVMYVPKDENRKVWTPVQKCDCLGISHRDDCSEWELPL